MMEHFCDCGGEMQLDSFDPITRPVEWFLRCRKCGDMTDSEPTQEAALASLNDRQPGTARVCACGGSMALHGDDVGGGRYWTCCQACHWIGPWGHSKGEAVSRWNASETK